MGRAIDIETLTAALERRYGGFQYRGLHLERRDTRADVEKLFGVAPERLPDPLHFWIVIDETGEAIGEVSRSVLLRGDQLMIAHKQQRIYRPEWRGRGFGSALLDACERWYVALDVGRVVVHAEGDGSLFAARRGFDFDTTAYGSRPKLAGMDERQLRASAVCELVRRPGVLEADEGCNATRGPSVLELLDLVAEIDDDRRALVEEFRRRIPTDPENPDHGSFRTPQEIAGFAAERRVALLGGDSLGRAVLRHSSWRGVKTLA